MKKTMLLGVLFLALAGCGGGGGDAPTVVPKAVAPVPTVVYRPCETTGSGAPPCPTGAQ